MTGFLHYLGKKCHCEDTDRLNIFLKKKLKNGSKKNQVSNKNSPRWKIYPEKEEID